MATFRTVLNRVLRTVAEDEVEGAVDELSDSYHKLVATFLNQIKEEIEDAHNWRNMQRQHTATVTALANEAVIVGADERSRLARVNTEQGHAALVFDVTDATNPIPLTEIDVSQLAYRIATDIPGTGTEPSLFAAVVVDGVPYIRVYPAPTTQRTISLTMFTPQARLADTDLDEELLIPARPLEMGTIWYALEERGEEMGTSALFTEERWRKALDDAIARDAEEQGGFELQIV